MQQKLRLAVVYPWSSDFIWTKAVHSMLQLKHPEGVEIAWGRGTGWCSAARHNHAFRQALNWGADLILMLGADQVYKDRDMLCKLIEHYRNGHECVTALVPMRGYLASQAAKPFHLVGWRVKPDADGNVHINENTGVADAELVTREDGPLVRVHSVGSGVLMFPADALRTMQTPWCAEIPAQPDFDRATTADCGFVSKLQSEAGLEIMCDTTIRVTHLYPFEIDDTFSEKFKDWAEPGKGDPFICDYKRPLIPDTVIRQARVSPSIPFYDQKFRTRYKLTPYTDPTRPAIFFGCYSDEDIAAIRDHQSMAVVAWAGSDIQAIRKVIEDSNGSSRLPFGPNVHHIAISNFIEDDLYALGIQFKRLPLCCVDETSFQPAPHPQNYKSIYCYLPDHDRAKYGGEFIDQLKPLLPGFTWHIQTSHTQTPPGEMWKVYEKCAIGIRPTAHDGLSNSVIEMGLMGRRVLWNGNAPNALRCATPEDAAALIRQYCVPLSDYEQVAKATRQFLAIGEDWKSTEFYKQEAAPYDYKRYFDARYFRGAAGAGGPPPGSFEAEETLTRIRGLLTLHDCDTVLEVGCGSCLRWGEGELPEGYCGVDVSPVAIAHAQKKFPDASFAVLDATKDELPESDAVICVDVAQHIKPEDLHAFLNNLRQAARRLVIVKVTVNFPEQFDTYYQFDHDWRPDGWSEVETVPGAPHSRFFILEKAQVPA